MLINIFGKLFIILIFSLIIFTDKASADISAGAGLGLNGFRGLVDLDFYFKDSHNLQFYLPFRYDLINYKSSDSLDVSFNMISAGLGLRYISEINLFFDAVVLAGLVPFGTVQASNYNVMNYFVYPELSIGYNLLNF